MFGDLQIIGMIIIYYYLAIEPEHLLRCINKLLFNYDSGTEQKKKIMIKWMQKCKETSYSTMMGAIMGQWYKIYPRL